MRSNKVLSPKRQIDQAVTRLMTTRMKLGMFDDPEKVPFTSIRYTEVDSPEMRELNLQGGARKRWCC